MLIGIGSHSSVVDIIVFGGLGKFPRGATSSHPQGTRRFLLCLLRPRGRVIARVRQSNTIQQTQPTNHQRRLVLYYRIAPPPRIKWQRCPAIPIRLPRGLWSGNQFSSQCLLYAYLSISVHVFYSHRYSLDNRHMPCRITAFEVYACIINTHPPIS